MEGGRFQTANVVGVGGVKEMCVTPLDANIRFYFSTLRLQNSWVIRPEVMDELPT